MSLVCLAHFQDAYLYPLGIQGTGEPLSRRTRAAMPAFVLISGFVLGFLYAWMRRYERRYERR